MYWGGSLTDGWDGKPACLILDSDLSDSVWLLCCTGLTLKLFPSLLFTPPLGSLLGCSWLPPVMLWGVSVPECSLQCSGTGCFGTNLSAVGRGRSVSWHRYSQCLAVYLVDSPVLHGPGTGDAQDYSGKLLPSCGQDSPCLGDPHSCWGSVTSPTTLLKKLLLGVLSCSRQAVLKCFFPNRAGNSLT